MNIKSKLLLRQVIKLLVDCLELLNKIPEDDFRELVKTARTRKKEIKGILDNSGRANPFMIIFFVRELLESILNE
jgi:hypothetical protein